MIDTHDLTEAIKSQRNRYDALLCLVGQSENPPADPRIWTLIEDAAEFGRHLMIDTCCEE